MPNLGGGRFDFTEFGGGTNQNWSCLGGVSTILDFPTEFGGGTIDFHLFYPRYGGGTMEFCLFLARIWGGDIANFFVKLGVWGGCTSVRSKMGGVRIWRPKAADLAHPPPQDVFGTFPKDFF